MNRCNQKRTRHRLKRKHFDIRICDLDSKELYMNNLNALLRDQEVEIDYEDLLNFVIETTDPEKDFMCEDKHEYENKNENENGNKNEDEVVRIDENNKDPEYILFLENLTEHDTSYKLKVSKDDEEPRFLYYEEQNNSDWCGDLQTCVDDSGDEVTVSEDTQIRKKAKRVSTRKESSRRKKINEHKTITQTPRGPGITMEPCYERSLAGIPRVLKCEEEPVECEKNVTTSDSDSDSDVVILDNVQNCSEVNNKQIVLAAKEPSLREKLIYILKQPYNVKEYKELSEYIEQEKPVSLLKPLRHGRSRLFANAGVNKSVLDYGPEKFQRLLKDAQQDRPKALNLLRMFRFWLEHVPNDEVFQPWRDKQILKVRPSEKNALTHMQQLLPLLDYK